MKVSRRDTHHFKHIYEWFVIDPESRRRIDNRFNGAWVLYWDKKVEKKI